MRILQWWWIDGIACLGFAWSYGAIAWHIFHFFLLFAVHLLDRHILVWVFSYSIYALSIHYLYFIWRFTSCSIEFAKLVFWICFTPIAFVSIKLNYSLFEKLKIFWALKYNFRTTLKYSFSTKRIFTFDDEVIELLNLSCIAICDINEGLWYYMLSHIIRLKSLKIYANAYKLNWLIC